MDLPHQALEEKSVAFLGIQVKYLWLELICAQAIHESHGGDQEISSAQSLSHIFRPWAVA